MTKHKVDIPIGNPGATIGQIPLTKQLKPEYQIALILRYQGATYRQIAEHFGKAKVTVEKWFLKNGPLHEKYAEFCTQMAEHSSNAELAVMDQIKNACGPAAQKIAQLSQMGKTHDIQLRASQDLLNRGGYAPVQRNINIEAGVDDLTDQELNKNFQNILKRYDIEGEVDEVRDDEGEDNSDRGDSVSNIEDRESGSEQDGGDSQELRPTRETSTDHSGETKTDGNTIIEGED